MDSCLDFLEGSRSGTRYDADVLQRLDPIDGAPLLARYDLTRAARSLTAQALSTRDGLGMWRWSEILPVRSTRHRIHLGEGHTPLLGAFRLGPALGVDRLMVKAEGLNPTGSFKARGMSAAVSRARELGVRSLIAPSAGNAGGALATYGAAAGMPTTVVMPADTPDANIVEAQMAGAHVVLVEGVISDCGAVAGAIAARTGAFDVSTLKEPYRVEGKKTMGLELAEQLGWAVPDVVVYPTGGGTGLVGMWKAFDELEALGLIGSGRPRMVSVQAEGCAPIVHALAEGAETATPWPDPHTRASGLRVPSAVGDRLILQALRDSDGTAVAVPEAEIDSVQKLAGRRGVGYVSPESAAAFAAVASLATQGWLAASDRVVVFDTGIGQKYPPPSLPRPPVVRPDIVEDAEALELVLPGRIAPPTRPARPIAESSAESAQPAQPAPSTPSAAVEVAPAVGQADSAVAERPATDAGEPADEERPSPDAGTAADEEEVVRPRTALPPVRRPAPPAPRLAGRSRVWAALDESASPADPPAEDDPAEPARPDAGGPVVDEPADGVAPDLEAAHEMAVAAGEEAPSPAEVADASVAAPAAGDPAEVEADAAESALPPAEREIEGPTAAASSPADAVDPAVEAGASTPGQAAPSPTPDPAAPAEDDVAARAARAAEASRPLTADPLRIDPWAPRVPGEMAGGGSAGSTAPTVPGAAPGQGRPSPPPPVPGAAPHPLSGPGPLRTPDPAPAPTGPPATSAPTSPPAISLPTGPPATSPTSPGSQPSSDGPASPGAPDGAAAATPPATSPPVSPPATSPRTTSPTAPGSPLASMESGPPPGPTSAAAATLAPPRSPAGPPPDLGDTARLDQPAPPPVPADAGPTAGHPAPTADRPAPTAGGPAPSAGAAGPASLPGGPAPASAPAAAPPDVPSGALAPAADAPAGSADPVTPTTPAAEVPASEAPAGAADQATPASPGAAPPSPPAATPAQPVTETGSTGYTAFRPLPAPPFREIVVGPLPAPPRSR